MNNKKKSIFLSSLFSVGLATGVYVGGELMLPKIIGKLEKAHPEVPASVFKQKSIIFSSDGQKTEIEIPMNGKLVPMSVVNEVIKSLHLTDEQIEIVCDRYGITRDELDWIYQYKQPTEKPQNIEQPEMVTINGVEQPLSKVQEVVNLLKLDKAQLNILHEKYDYPINER